MPRKGFHHSEETKRRLSELNIGKPNGRAGESRSEEFKQRLSAILKAKWASGTRKDVKYSMTGKHHSVESKIKLSDWHKGRPKSEDHKRKIGLSNKGKKRPAGYSPWNKGKTLGPLPQETRVKIGVSLRSSPSKIAWDLLKSESAKNHPRRKDINSKISKALVGNSYRKGIPGVCTEEMAEKIRQWHLANPNRSFKDTKIEIAIRDELSRRGICFVPQAVLSRKFRVDVFLPERCIVIECDGCYYHGCAKCGKPGLEGKYYGDERRTKLLEEDGFKVFRFKEHEINESAAACVDQVQSWMNQNEYCSEGLTDII